MDFTPLRIRLPFGSEEEFVARYGVHVGRDGFFLATKSPKDVGAQLAFELVLADGTALLSGQGVVSRIVAGARSGMVVRFIQLDGAGTALVDRILAGRREAASEKAAAATTWHGDPTRDIARVTGPGGAPLPGARGPLPPGAARAPKESVPAPHEAPTWPGDPTRDVVRFASVDRPEQPNGPKVAVAAFDSPSPQDKDIPFHLRPTPALGLPETHTLLQTHLHTAITPVRGIPALGPEVVAFLTDRTPTVKTEALPVPGALFPSPASPADAPTVLSRGPEGATASAPSVLPSTSAEASPAPPAAPVKASPTALPATREAGDETPTVLAPPPPVRRTQASDAIPLPAPSTVQPVAAVRAAPVAAPPEPPLRVKPPAAGEQSTPADEAPTERQTVPATSPGASAVTSATAEPALGVAVLGLHLGTSSARMAWVREGRVEVLPADTEGTAESLACRLVRDGHGVLRVLQPGEAEEALWVGSPVTLLGTRADSPAVRTLVRRWPVPVVADDRGEVAFDWGGVTVTAVELVATLLRSLRGAAERRTGRACSQAVLVVPATFTLLQRARFREAAERAGLSVLRLLNAPTAAALAFAYDKGMARRRVLVWRMGAATCDAAVVAVSGNDLDVVSIGGDGALGGVNFDEQLALGLDKLARSEPARLRTRVAQAERCKQTLSTSERGLVPPAVDGEPVLEVSRMDLELRTAALVERSVLLAQDVIRAAGLTPESLDALVLAGGMARLPQLRRAVEAAFGKTAETEPEIQSGAAMGAALLGATLSAPSVSGRARPKVVEVLAVPLEAVAPEFGHQRAFERNTRLPAEKTLTLTLPAGQPLEVQLFQGLARAPDPRSFLGLLQSPGVERPGEWALHLGLSADGLLQAAVTPPGAKRRPLALQTAPAPTEPGASGPEGEEADPGARLLGGLKRLFGKK
jgi:molecular chaperone DnaK